MLVRYLPVIFLLTALVLALAPLEAAGQSAPAAPGPNASDAGQAQAETSGKADKPRPKTGGAPVNASQSPVPPGADARRVRPAEAVPPERLAPSGPQAPNPAAASPSPKDDPRSVEERPDPGG